MIEQAEELNFDQIYLGFEDAPGGDHLATAADVELARNDYDDHMLIISNEAELFCTLIVHHGYMPSDAYTQAFTKANEDGVLVKPESPAYLSRMLLRQPEIKARIEEIRGEIREWGKTSFEEVEMNYRRIALDPRAKDSDRIAATKALCNLRGFDAQPDSIPGAVINITLPFQPQQLGKGVTYDAVQVEGTAGVPVRQ